MDNFFTSSGELMPSNIMDRCSCRFEIDGAETRGFSGEPVTCVAGIRTRITDRGAPVPLDRGAATCFDAG